jgi:beta-glucanase (GH16 family)
MKRITQVFLALCLVATTNCRFNGDGLTLVADPETNASGGATGWGGTKASGGAIGSGGTTVRGGATGSDAGHDSGGITSVGGAQASGGANGTGGGAGSGGSPNRDGATDSPAALVVDGPPGLLADAGVDLPGDASAVDSPAIAEDSGGDAAVDAHPAVPLVWSDEFSGAANTGVDATKWSYVTWDPGHVNNEAQKYTSRLENVFQDGAGHLVIRAITAPNTGGAYTSGRIESNGHFIFQYGRVEVRAKLPAGIGSFPGIVAMGSTGVWPKCGELAIMEQYGQDKSWFYTSATAGGGNGSGDTGHVKYTFPDATTASRDFHIYSLDWYADHIAFQVDGIEITRTTFAASSPFYSIPEYLILNLALGGNMGGAIDPNAFPMDMIVDYVRVYSF